MVISTALSWFVSEAPRARPFTTLGQRISTERRMGLPRNLLYIIRTSFPVRAGIDYPLLHLSPARLSFVVGAYEAYYHGLRPFLLVLRYWWSPGQVLVDGSGNAVSISSISQMCSVSPAAIAGERLIQRRLLPASSKLSIRKVFSARPKL